MGRMYSVGAVFYQVYVQLAKIIAEPPQELLATEVLDVLLRLDRGEAQVLDPVQQEAMVV